MKLEQLDQIMTRIAADEPSKVIEIEAQYSEEE